MNHFTPYASFKLGMELYQTMFAAQTVITMRMLGMAGLWYASPRENAIMVQEKQAAAMKSATRTFTAALSGKSPTEIYRTALAPYKQRTLANSRRLTKGKR